MKIKKEWISWEEFEKIQGGTWRPAAHTHPRSEIPDFWSEAFWASIPDKPSTFPPSSHDHDDRYYTETELNEGQLDSRYYTETELNEGQLDNIYFGEDEFLASSAGAGDSGKPLKLNAAGLVDPTMLGCGGHDYFVKVGAGGTPDYLSISYFEWTEAGHVMIKKTTKLVDVNVDMVDGKHDTDFAAATHYHTLASLTDTLIVSPEDGELLMWDAEANGGKWVCSTEIPSHTHDDRYYTETELNNGQLDNIYFGEDEFLVTTAGAGDSGKPIKLNAAGLVDNTMLTTKEPVISAGTTAQYWRGDKTWQALAGSHSHNDLYYTEGEVDTKLALQDTLAEMDDTTIVAPQDGEFLVYDDGPGKWVCSSVLAPHASAHEVGGDDLVSHDGLTDFVGNEHINHTAVSISTGSGLTGGGTIASTRTLSLSTLTANWDAGNYEIRARTIRSDVVTGTAPFNVASTTKVISLNADLLEGYHASKAAGNNTVVIRNASGYIYCNYLNCTSGETATNPTHYFVEIGNDSFLRQMTPANFVTQLAADGVMPKAGGIFTAAVEAADHILAGVDKVVNVSYGTGNPPTANTTTRGSLFIKYV